MKHGRGSQRKTKVVVIAESKPVEGKTTKKGKPRKVGYLKMIVIDNLLSKTIDSVVEQSQGQSCKKKAIKLKQIFAFISLNKNELCF